MSEPFVNPIFGERGKPTPDLEAAGTGQPEVDAVIGSLAALDDLPIADHVAVFEQAHESLRRTLAGPATRPDDRAAGRG